MSTSTANHSAIDHSLFADSSKFIATLFGTPKAPPRTIVPVRSVGAKIWQFFLMSAGLNSVNPELLAQRIVHD